MHLCASPHKRPQCSLWEQAVLQGSCAYTNQCNASSSPCQEQQTLWVADDNVGGHTLCVELTWTKHKQISLRMVKLTWNHLNIFSKMWINCITIDFIIYIIYDIHKTNYQNSIQKAVIFLKKYKKTNVFWEPWRYYHFIVPGLDLALMVTWIAHFYQGNCLTRLIFCSKVQIHLNS